jgi:hypothetical protein
MIKTVLITVLTIVSMLTECYDVYVNYSEYKPVLMTREQLEKSIAYSAAREMVQPGKIFIKGDTIFINEKYKGIHVIDNSNPENPKNIGFIIIPGCMDISMKNQVLYADNSVDLIAINLSKGLNRLNVTERLRETFPELTPPDNRVLQSQYLKGNRPANTLIVGWEKITDE